MLRLPDLPNEILRQILRYLLPDDVDNFCKAREVFHAVATGLLPKHGQLKSSHTEVSCGETDNKTFHPLSLLRDICQNPEIVWYVKTMHIEDCTDEVEYVNGEAWDEARSIAVDHKDGIAKLVRDCPYIDVEKRKRWVNRILGCHQNAAVALLACILPCLEGISITNSYQNTELHSLVRKIGQANRRSPRGSHALGKLEWVREESDTSDIFVNIDSFKPFSALPSLRRYTGQYLVQTASLTPSEQKSTITTLDLSQSMIHTEALRSIFSRIANLKILKYEYYWAWEDVFSEGDWCNWRRDWQPGQIVLDLLQFASHSLVELDLTRSGSTEKQRAEKARERLREGRKGKNDADDDEEDFKLSGPVNLFMGSLQGFQVLKYIRIQHEAMVEEDAGGSSGSRKVHRLVDVLPASAVRVSLALPRLCPSESRMLREGLTELKAERVPNLEKLIIETSRGYKKMKIVYEVGGIRFMR